MRFAASGGSVAVLHERDRARVDGLPGATWPTGRS